MKTPMGGYARFEQAEKLFASGDYESAGREYLSLVNSTYAPYAYYRLAAIMNIAGDPVTAQRHYYRAFELKHDLCKDVLPEDHPNHDYVFHEKKQETPQDSCVLCGNPGEPYWCYCVLETASSHVQYYNPVRLWMRCANCNHLYAQEYTDQSLSIPSDSIKADAAARAKVWRMPTRVQLCSYYSELLSTLSMYTEGNDLLEVGFGGCECLLAANEMGFSTFGIDIAYGNVLQAGEYGIDAEQQDFDAYQTSRKWDMIIMGDVLEHVPNPVRTIEKVYGLLNDGGVVWISTPNFEAAFSIVSGHGDAMRREAAHKNYFSRYSLINLLTRYGFLPVNYRISSHYGGSMEVTAVKQPLAADR